jgi:hypothetical protein
MSDLVDISEQVEICAMGRRRPSDGFAKRFGPEHHHALALCLSMIFSENRFPLFRIML